MIAGALSSKRLPSDVAHVIATSYGAERLTWARCLSVNAFDLVIETATWPRVLRLPDRLCFAIDLNGLIDAIWSVRPYPGSERKPIL